MSFFCHKAYVISSAELFANTTDKVFPLHRLKVLQTLLKAPNANAICERFLRSIREEVTVAATDGYAPKNAFMVSK